MFESSWFVTTERERSYKTAFSLILQGGSLFISLPSLENTTTRCLNFSAYYGAWRIQRALACDYGMKYCLSHFRLNFHSRLVACSWKPIKCMQKALFRGLNQYKAIRIKQTVDHAASYCDTLIDSAVTVYPIHIDERRQHKSLSELNIYCEWLWFKATDTDKLLSREYHDLMASNRRPSTPCSRTTPKNVFRGDRLYTFSWLPKHV